jgi:hypothetical protein
MDQNKSDVKNVVGNISLEEKLSKVNKFLEESFSGFNSVNDLREIELVVESLNHEYNKAMKIELATSKANLIKSSLEEIKVKLQKIYDQESNEEFAKAKKAFEDSTKEDRELKAAKELLIEDTFIAISAQTGKNITGVKFNTVSVTGTAIISDEMAKELGVEGDIKGSYV